MAKSNEPFLWTLFGAGGMVAALLMPVTILITSVLLMCNLVTTDKLLALCGNPLVRLDLFVLISLPLFHWAHRFRFTLVDLGLKAAKGPIAVLCYGSALTGTVIAALVLLGIWA